MKVFGAGQEIFTCRSAGQQEELGPYQLIGGSSGRIAVQCATISVQSHCCCLTMALKESSKHQPGYYEARERQHDAQPLEFPPDAYMLLRGANPQRTSIVPLYPVKRYYKCRDIVAQRLSRARNDCAAHPTKNCAVLI